MEVGKGIVYPRMYTLDDVLIESVSFVVVKVDMVHENMKNLNLEVPPDDMTLTLRDAVTRRVQWRRTSIDVDPATILASTIPSQSQPHTIPSLSPPQNTPSQSWPQTTLTMPQPQTTTQLQQQPHAMIIPETRPELTLEEPPLPSPPQTRSTPPAPVHMQSKGTQALKQKTTVRS
jgi:hypothetical protein